MSEKKKSAADAASASANVPANEAEERARIHAETAKIAWQELQRFFAQGLAIGVKPELDLVDVACEMSYDNKDRIEAWMESGKIAQVSDAQAIEWHEANVLMWCVVIRPWILVQPVLADEADAQD
jgi:hypothetical protein